MEHVVNKYLKKNHQRTDSPPNKGFKITGEWTQHCRFA